MLGDWVSFVYIMVPLEKRYVVSYDFVTYIVVVLKKVIKSTFGPSLCYNK